MTLKEKLELLWKYLLLVVIVFGLVQMGKNRPPRMMSKDCSGPHGEKMMWFNHGDDDMKDMDFDVEVMELEDGDTTVKIIINGKTIDLEDMEAAEGAVFIKKMKGPGDHKVKIIKKRIMEDEGED
ncbi:MAG: hypothetical protein K9N29_01255 [Candidatus Marinimicrobia bacterium]|nr:hypothetical protein [Candidatus Neomarinimicrobiota bacterium]